MTAVKVTKTPESATGKSKLADDDKGLNPGTLALLWDVSDLQRNLQLSRRSIHNLRKRGLPTIVLGRSVRFDPESVKRWLRSKERGGVE
jgi:hypothetical protein